MTDTHCLLGNYVTFLVLSPVYPMLPLSIVYFPAGRVLKSMLAVGVKGAFGILGALLGDPRAEPIAFDLVGHRDSGMMVVFDILQQSGETLLRTVGAGVPCPAGQVFESAFAIGVKGAFGILFALLHDPRT